ncbi:MAG TPA: cysteine hydrolase, partial [Acidimicrobiales bacterium]|nr:cysteine hydrolase [Acidimicrobiales bacterium]
QGVLERVGGSSEVVAAVGRAIAGARAAGLPVVYVRLLFRAGYPEVSPANPVFAAVRDRGRFTEADEGALFPPAIAPEPGDVVVTKKRVSAFSGSDLELVLRASGITTVVLAGVATSGVVLSTLCEAADLDFGAVVLRDACADADDEVHRVLLDKVFPRRASVRSVDEWVRALHA